MSGDRPNPFRYLLGRGYHRLIPIIPPDAPISERSSLFKRLAAGEDPRGKVPGVRSAHGSWASFDWVSHHTLEEDLQRWFAMEAGVGIKTGGPDNLAAIDADTLDARLAGLIKAEVLSTCGQTPIRIGRSPKALYLVRTSGSLPYVKLLFNGKERVEILTEGKQFVAAGTHPGTMAPYTWPGALVDMASLPVIAPEALIGMLNRLRDVLPAASAVERQADLGADIDQSTLRGDPALLDAAMAALPNSNASYPSRESYLGVGYALRAALPDDVERARGLFQDWCAKWDGGCNDPDVVDADFSRMKPPFRRGAGWLFEEARRETGGEFQAAALRWFETPPVVAEPLFPEEPGTGAGQPMASLLGTPYQFKSGAEIEPREFLYGSHYQREYVSVTVAPTKVGKTALSVVEALAMVSGKPLLGVQPEGLLRVRIWNGEDPRIELERRIAAAMQHHGLTASDIGDRLLLDSGRDQPIVVAKQARDGAVILAPVVDGLVAALRSQAVDVFIVDPFVKSHRASENDNMAIDLVAAEWNKIAGLTRCAGELVQHSRKLNGGEVSIEDSRGASALVSAARSARVLARMTEAQGRTLGRPEDYRSLFRFADAQSNMAPPPSSGVYETWLELRSVALANARYDSEGRLLRRCDRVGVVILSETHGKTDEVAEPGPECAEEEAQAMAALATGRYRTDIRAGDAWAGTAIARAFGLDLTDAAAKLKVSTILRAWVQRGKLHEIVMHDAHRKPRSYIEVVALNNMLDAF